ncbi:MAG: hypothetical protein CMN79_04800 [Spirochaetales bacterium]|nr:hypothetical protein [Spirochaetales bacterium]
MDTKIFIDSIKQKYKFYTNKEVAEYFGVTRSRVSQWLNTNKIPKRYIDKERYIEEEKINHHNDTEIIDYKKIIKKQLNHIELLEERIELYKFKRETFIKEVHENWDYDVKISFIFNSLRKTLPEEVITSSVEVKKLNDYLGYTREEFKNNILSWLNSPMVDKKEVLKLYTLSEERRMNAIKNEIDSYIVSNHIKYYKKNGDSVWTIYRAYYDLNQNSCITKLKILHENALDD